MMLDRAVPAQFLKSAFRDDDLIVIAYRCLTCRRVAQQSQLQNDIIVADGRAGAGDDPAVLPKPRRPIWHHRFVTAATASSRKYLAWLRYLNASGNDIYVSMNSFVSREGRRTEANVLAIRHVYADFDHGGSQALRALRERRDLPPASYVIHSSRGKFQVIWNVKDFEPLYAKRLLCHLAYTLRADPAVHDLNRVLRLPGFFNLKYSQPPFVRLEIGDDLGPHGPSDFPVPPEDALNTTVRTPDAHTKRSLHLRQAPSRSESDWTTVRAALKTGASWHDVCAALVRARPDKANPLYYATLTVSKALNSLGHPLPPELVAALDSSRLRGPRE